MEDFFLTRMRPSDPLNREHIIACCEAICCKRFDLRTTTNFSRWPWLVSIAIGLWSTFGANFSVCAQDTSGLHPTTKHYLEHRALAADRLNKSGIRGTVVDDRDYAFDGVYVEITKQDTTQVKNAVDFTRTQSNGIFSMDNLSPGIYSIEFIYTSVKSTINNIVVREGVKTMVRGKIPVRYYGRDAWLLFEKYRPDCIATPGIKTFVTGYNLPPGY